MVGGGTGGGSGIPFIMQYILDCSRGIRDIGGEGTIMKYRLQILVTQNCEFNNGIIYIRRAFIIISVI